MAVIGESCANLTPAGVGATLAQLGCGGLPNDKKPKRHGRRLRDGAMHWALVNANRVAELCRAVEKSQRYCTWQSWSPLENFAVGYLSEIKSQWLKRPRPRNACCSEELV
ncbi:unnamed protein product [Effrenium voratum]|uniref:Uncharacterized protein n=1 Tax=Effrenium voratum TaxID=2562239 RepID=A0AA36I4Y1_9DINO|nr:unnamed protein product [Effrenium voratum]